MSWAAALALVCFAANSVLARLALGSGRIDPASFTAIRLASGAVALGLLLRAARRPVADGRTGGRKRETEAPDPPVYPHRPGRDRWLAALFLFLYAAPFSFAYVTLPTGTGALVLFGAVQLTMIGAGLGSGERPRRREWAGLAVAGAGLVYLNLPGIGAPSPLGVALMAIAGAAWGFYSLRGRRADAPLAQTADAFLLATPMGLAMAGLGALAFRAAGGDGGGSGAAAHLSGPGVAFAVASGALASGGGYAVWYAALPRMSATRAGTIQLAVPVLAALAGVAILGERVSLRLVLSAAAILGGVAVAIGARD
ncbi:MAG TPA: DMT family transporter [Gemmatimonadales bacterium]|nr:DMT family transporter [Gemmatimonadales bacterium]